MTLQDWGICLTLAISTMSLLISVFNYWTSKPKLRIEITDKEWDCFFGKIVHEGTDIQSYVGGAQISIVNNSPVAITLNRINLIVGKEMLRLVNNKNKFWECVEFYFLDDNGELTTDGSGIYYAESGLELPLKINAYDTITAVVLFHNFPCKQKKQCKGRIVLNTAIGKVKKNVKLVEYDKNYLEEGYRDYLQYCRSIDEGEENNIFRGR